MNIQLTPKKRFQTNKSARDQHKKLVESDHVHHSLETALAEYSMRFHNQTDPTVAAQLKGAKEFMGVWLNLAEESPAAQPTTPSHLIEPEDPYATGPYSGISKNR